MTKWRIVEIIRDYLFNGETNEKGIGAHLTASQKTAVNVILWAIIKDIEARD